MIRTTVFLTESQYTSLADLAKNDSVGGVKPSHFIRRFISEGLARLKRQAPAAK